MSWKTCFITIKARNIKLLPENSKCVCWSLWQFFINNELNIFNIFALSVLCRLSKGGGGDHTDDVEISKTQIGHIRY